VSCFKTIVIVETNVIFMKIFKDREKERGRERSGVCVCVWGGGGGERERKKVRGGGRRKEAAGEQARGGERNFVGH